MRLFKWFKRKKKEEKIDFEKYHMVLNIKTICYFEMVTGKHFFNTQITDEDISYLLYSMLVVNNDIVLTYPAFKILLEDPRVMRWCMVEGEKMRRKMEMILPNRGTDDTEGGEKGDLSVTDVATYLIVKHRMDAHYVMYEMDLWEMNSFVLAGNDETQYNLENDRLWTYLTMLPHIDGKKLTSPKKLLPFPWEEDSKDKKFDNNAEAAKKFLGGQANG